MTRIRFRHLGILSACAAFGCTPDDVEPPTASSSFPLEVPQTGAAWQLASLPYVRLTVVDPATGGSRHTFLLGEGPACRVTHARAGEAMRSSYDCAVSGGPWTAPLAVAAEVDYLDGAWGSEAHVRLRSLPPSAAVEALGLELRFADTPEREHVVYTAYSGGHVVDEPATAAGGPTLGRRDFSIQAIPYWADDGSALLVWAADPSGEEPKDIVARPVPGAPASLALGWEALAPNSHVGGQPFDVPFPIRFTKHAGDWYDAAKIYRAWLESEARDPGEILELGRLEQRDDVSRFMKQLDLIGVNNTLWYQGTPEHQQALRSIARLPGELGVSDAVYMFWGTSDPNDPYGLPGTWLPWQTFASDTSVLLDAGVRSLLYTMPQVWSAKNPALAETGAWQHLAEDRDGKPYSFAPDELYGDTASEFWTPFFRQLAGAHASAFSGVHGFYTDNPYAVLDDFVRPSGQRLGLTRSAFTGLCAINRAMRQGGQEAVGEFMTVHESGTERLVRCSDVEAAGGHLTRLYAPFYTADMPARYVPFFQSVLSGYTVVAVGDVRFGTSTLPCGLWGSTLVESFENMARAQAAAVSYGGVPTWSELRLGQGLLTPEWTEKEILGQDPKVVVAPFVAHVAALVAARDRARAWLAFGELLRDPAVSGDRVTMHLRAPYGPTSDCTQFATEDHDEPKVATGAFRAADGTVRILVANGGRDDASTTLDLARVGLAAALRLSDPAAGVEFAVQQGRVTLAVPAGAVWVLQ